MSWMPRTFFGACQIALMLALVPVQSHALTAANPPPSQSARVYLNPNTGRFWTMDSYDGNNEAPLSLNKYLYGWDNPVDHIDPSGHDIGDMLGALDIGGMLDSMISPVTMIGASRVADEFSKVPDPSWSWKSVTVNTVVLYGAEDKTERDFHRAEEIYAQARIHINRGTSKTLTEADTKRVVGDNLIVQGYQQMGRPTSEELALTRGQSPDTVTAYYVQGLSGSTEGGMAYGESFNKEFAKPPYRAIIVANRANYVVMSHELGHVLWEESGVVHDDFDFGNLMASGGHNTQMGILTYGQCWRMRQHWLVHD
jgi:hypothetical protein